MKLIEVYATACGLKIGRPDVKERFFPLGFSDYITVQSGSGQTLKNYDLINDALRLLSPFLQKAKLQVVHLGGKDDMPIPGAVSLLGMTSLQQSLYVLRRSRLHLGPDSWQAHMSAEAGIPLVAMYGTTSVREHGPYWKDDAKTILLESHRTGRIPSFGSGEPIKTVNLIPPELVANSVLKLLGIQDKVSINNTLYIGQYYGQPLFEVIPNMVIDPNLYPGVAATVRMDYLFNEDYLLKQAQNRKIHVFMDKPINLDLIKSILPQMLGLNYEVNLDTDITYVRALKKLGGRQILFSKETNQAALDAIRFKFFDISPVEFVDTKTRDKFLVDAAVYTNESAPIDFAKMRFASSKLIFSDNKTYLSKADWKADKPITNIENPESILIDSPDFWQDYPHHHIYL